MCDINTWDDGDDFYRSVVEKQVSEKDTEFRCGHAKFKNV